MQASSRAWQPLTPRGVAAFAGAPLSRLLLVQFVFAVCAATAAAWFLYADGFPVIRAAIRQLPPRGEIRSGRLNWAGDSPRMLAEGRFLAFTVDLNHAGAARSPAQFQVEFGRENVRIFSLFGYTECAYPKDWIIAFNRPELQPWWGAWEAPLSGIAVGGVIACLMVSWALLETLYGSAAWLTGYFANRNLNLRGCWKLAGAALMPGALLMTAGIIFYGLGVLDLVELMVTAGAHFVVGWIYLFVSLFFTPRLPASSVAGGNPFVTPASEGTGTGENKKEARQRLSQNLSDD